MCCCGKNQNKYSKFKILYRQIDDMPRKPRSLIIGKLNIPGPKIAEAPFVYKNS